LRERGGSGELLTPVNAADPLCMTRTLSLFVP
jgi:hypothetical protein